MSNVTESGNEFGKDKDVYRSVYGLDQFIKESHIQESHILLPINVFSYGPSGLESISNYLKEAIGLRYCEIAELLNRDDRTIWGACDSAREKTDSSNFAQDSSIKIPISIFKDRTLSILEALAEYLKEELNLRYCQIANLLNKDPRTIWTVYNRAKKKRRHKQNEK